MKSGATAILSHHYIVPSLGYLRLQGTEGTVTYKIDSNEVEYRKGRDMNCIPSPTNKYLLPTLDDRLEQVVEFADAIQKGRPLETGFRVGFRAVYFVEKALESTQKGERMTF